MAKTSKGVILSQASQIKSDYSFALIKATADNKSLVQDASSAELKVNALVEYSKDSQWDPKKLTNLGFPAGCFLIVDLRGQDIHAADLITNLALVRQYGYQAGVIDDLSTLDDIKALKANQIYLINSGKTNDDQDASLNGNEITDGSGKLAVGMSVKWQRDYTNVDVSGDHAGFVGMGQDTLLKGGNAFGYSTNGRDFNAVITPKGLIFRRPDAERMWRLLKPNEIADINSTVGDKVKKEVDSATAEIPAAVSAANSAVQYAESAVAASKVNSDAIVAQSEAISEAKSAMDSATAEIQQLKANAASDVAQIESTIAEVQTSINQAKSANESAVQAVQAELKSTSDSMDKVEKRLDEVDTSLDAYAKSAAEQGHDITLIKQKQGQFEADFASAQGNVNQIQADIKGLRQNIKDNQGNIATLLTSADKLQASMKDAQNNISNLLLTASEYEQTFKDQDGRLSKVEQTATEHTSELTDTKGNLDKVTQKANALQLLLSDAQKNIQNIQLDAKGLHDTLTGQSNQLASLNVTLNNLDSKYSGITGDLQSKQTALSTEQQQTKDMLLRKADKSEVDNVKGTVNQVSAEQKTMADQINQKVSSVEYQTLKDKVNGMKIGTRNLLHHSDTFEGWHRGSTVSIAGSKYLNGTVAILAPGGSGGNALNADLDGPYDNQPISWTVYAKADNTGDKLHTELWGGGGLTEQPLTTEWQVYKFTGQRDARKHSFLLWGCVGNKGNIYVALPFAVVGNYIGTWLANPTDTITSINKNSTAIDENSKLISLKANQTDVDNIKGTAQQLSARLDVVAGEVKSKVDETRVNNIVDGKGYATTSTVQSLVDQKAGTLSDTITELDRKIGDNHSDSIKRIQSLTASIDGLQSRVTNYQNDTSSKYTQLSNLMQSKVGTADFEQLKRSVDMQTLDSADINNMKTNGHYFVHNLTNSPIAGWVYVDVTGNGNNRIRQDVYQDNGIQHKYRRWVDTHWTGWEEGATYTEITQLQDAVNLRVQKGELLSQINLTAGNTLIQSNKIYLDSSSTVFSGKAFIPSAAIVSLDADKINTGTLNTQMVSIGDDQTRLWARSNYLYLTGKDQGDAYNMRIGGDKIEFVTTEIPNGAPYMDGITPMYQIAYDGDTKSRLKIRSFNRLTGSNEFPIEMYDSVNISKDEIDLAANNQMKLSIRDDGVHVRRSLFFENGGGTGVFGGFTRADNSNIVEFSTGDNNGENFRIDCGARFMQYVYINGNARAQQWLTNSALSKKMNIRKLDLQTALNKIRQDDQYLYEYKRNVAQGIHDPQASFIIDDVHDVAHYSVPREFIDNTGKYREPSVELAYLIAAFQAIDKQVQAQQAEIKILKERLQHE